MFGTMTRALAVGAGIAVALVLGAADGTAGRSQSPTLFGRVGPGFGISLKNADGASVAKLDPGTYDIAVEDLAEEHNFHLTGPGVDQRTEVAETGKVTWSVTLADGVYRFFCDAHPTTLRGTFTVGNVAPEPPPPPPGAVTPKSKLVLSSGPGFVITLKTAAGKKVTQLTTGTYDVTVRDRSPAHDARLVAPGYRRATTVPFVGTQRWRVKLAKVGTLRFLCDVHAARGMRGTAKIVR